MTYSAETVMLKDGNAVTIRSVEPEDAPIMLQYTKIMLGETPYRYDSNLYVCGMGKDNLLAVGET